MPTRILLAEDHALIRQGLKALLETQGFQVVGEASDGQGTLRLAEKTQPDVAILDISMPVLNGMDTARELKKSSPNTGRSRRMLRIPVHFHEPSIRGAQVPGHPFGGKDDGTRTGGLCPDSSK